MDILEISDGDVVLDIATGTGDMAVPAALRGGKVVGIDLSEQMLMRALSKAVGKVFLSGTLLCRAMPCSCHSERTRSTGPRLLSASET